MPRPRPLATATVAFCTVIALSTLASGIDYFADCLGIDELLRGNVHAFFAMQPLQGSVSLLLRAPFVTLVFHQDIATVYYAGLIPCYAALLAATLLLWRRMEGRALSDRVLVAFLCAGSPLVVKAVHWGHPEDLLATALVLGAMLSAARGRAVLAGVLLGTAYASKQWALVAGLPVLLALPRGHARFVLSAVATAAVFVVPMAIGDPARFWLVTRDAGSAVPGHLIQPSDMPSTRVLPQSLWQLFSHPEAWGVHHYRFAAPALLFVAHPIMVLAGVPFAYALWRRGDVSLVDATRLLVLVLLLRCVLDPNDLDYYHVPVVSALALLAALGGERELRLAVCVTAGLSVAFVQPATKLDTVAAHAWLKWAVYMATVVPLTATLVRDLLGLPRLSLARRRAEAPVGLA